MKAFNVNEIWAVGFRVYYGEDYVTSESYEEEAYKHFQELVNPDIGMKPEQFCKRINHLYRQRIEKLQELKADYEDSYYCPVNLNETYFKRILGSNLHRLRDSIFAPMFSLFPLYPSLFYRFFMENSKEFLDIKLIHKPSVIGLPYVLSFSHRKSKTTTEFDGMIFVTKKRLLNEQKSVLEAKEFVEEKGGMCDDSCQAGINPNLFEKLIKIGSSLHCGWSYVANIDDFNDVEVKYEGNKEHIIFRVSFIDMNFIRAFSPTGEREVGKKYNLYLGDISHICQVLAHNAETARELNLLGERLRVLRERIISISRNLIKPVPLIPEPKNWWKINSWNDSLKYWANLHQEFEILTKFKLLIPCYKEIGIAFKKLSENGIGFYNLKGPFMANKLSQYPTIQPRDLIIDSQEVKIGDYDKSHLIYAGYPDWIISYCEWLDKKTSNIFELSQNLTNTSGIQAAVNLAIIVLILTVLGLLLSIISLFKSLFMDKNPPMIGGYEHSMEFFKSFFSVIRGNILDFMSLLRNTEYCIQVIAEKLMSYF